MARPVVTMTLRDLDKFSDVVDKLTPVTEALYYLNNIENLSEAELTEALEELDLPDTLPLLDLIDALTSVKNQVDLLTINERLSILTEALVS